MENSSQVDSTIYILLGHTSHASYVMSTSTAIFLRLWIQHKKLKVAVR